MNQVMQATKVKKKKKNDVQKTRAQGTRKYKKLPISILSSAKKVNVKYEQKKTQTSSQEL